MAGSPVWKVYDAQGAYQAACKEVEAAACLVGLYGIGAQIRHDHKTVCWTEGVDGRDETASYDRVAEVCYAKLAEGRKQ